MGKRVKTQLIGLGRRRRKQRVAIQGRERPRFLQPRRRRVPPVIHRHNRKEKSLSNRAAQHRSAQAIPEESDVS